ncbi:hypothetical protein PLIIFM63780_002352 [Purpureocillium lilacinum]|uniref:Ribosomal protein/carboxylic ester hydrolase n=1 Tax=Purpureocillium lilacinum TaxID=33203 RepID=A0A179GBF5_PURLI|nr:ribosomal protein/carboxylic ester hydrolase [Purpureocillium lilacinum]GJN71058.1 hypothetical protein PLICBS_005119 [Purpureocillium lilacinum]GJN78842.1 hypothetical protein PLIIFM63780_002352 [Purpureocillium lilacinum]
MAAPSGPADGAAGPEDRGGRPTIRDSSNGVVVNGDPNDDDAAQQQDSDMQAEPTENGYRYDSFPSYNNRRRRTTDTESHHHHNGAAPSVSHNSGTTPHKAAGAGSSSVTSTRALAPDLLRGLLMIVMALDHNAIALHTWTHGTGRASESDGFPVRRFNFPVAYAVRTLTHLCAPGFTFLLGMGVVYLGRSRRGKLGWSAGRLARYLAVRTAVLTGVTVVFGLVVTGGRVWFLNMVLFALAVDYLLAGLLWLAMDWTEGLVTGVLAGWMKSRAGEADDDEGERRPLLTGETTVAASGEALDSRTARAASISWHIHNAVLLILSLITIWWNIWLSENNGHCQAESSAPFMFTSSSPPFTSTPSSATTTTTAPQNPLLRIWFWPVMDMSGRVMSGFPPLAWLSFAILGLLYGRILVAQPSRPPRALFAGHALVSLLFALVFVLTRLLHIGNLSEGCLQTPAQQHQQRGQNPYLADVPSFFYIVKYPPDVAFWALTMAGNLALLALFGALPVRFARQRLTMLLDFGTTALFFYVAHMLVIFALGMALVALFGHDTGVADPMDPDNSRGIDNLWAYFAVWAAAMLMLWPVCRAYSRFKSTKSADSIWRFF